MNEQIIEDIKHFESVTKDRYEVMEHLLKKGYSQNEIVSEFDRYPFKPEWSDTTLEWEGNVLGFLMIGLAVFIGFNIASTWGSFDYEFDSSGDFLRLNEWVLKPFFVLTLIFSGISVSIKKYYINKEVKRIMMLFFFVFIITSVISNSLPSILIGLTGIFIFMIYNVPQVSSSSDAKMIIRAIESGDESRKSIIKRVIVNKRKKWKGSAIFIFLFLACCLFLNSQIDVNTEVVSQTENSTRSKISLQTIDVILFLMLKTLLVLSLLVSVFLGIDLKKFKVLLFGMVALAGIYIIATVFHSNFQVSIFPSMIVIVSGMVVLIKNRLLSTKTFKKASKTAVSET